MYIWLRAPYIWLAPGPLKPCAGIVYTKYDYGFIHKPMLDGLVDLNLAFCILTLRYRTFSTVLGVFITWSLGGTYGFYFYSCSCIWHICISFGMHDHSTAVLSLHTLLEFYCVTKLVGNDVFCGLRIFEKVFECWFLSVLNVCKKVFYPSIWNFSYSRKLRTDGKERKLAQSSDNDVIVSD